MTRTGRPRRSRTATEASGPVIVKVAAMGEIVKEVMLKDGQTIEDALDAAGFSPDDSEDLQMNGRDVELEDAIERDAIITLNPQVDGGC